mgnify:CR=1 FL=1
MVPAFMLFSTQAIWFLVPALLSALPDIRLEQSRYSIGVLALAHSAQYLWITSYYAKREALTEGAKRWHPLIYFAVLIVGGIALFIQVPGSPATSSTTTSRPAFNLHGYGESASLHFGWSDLEAQRRPYRGIAFEFAGQAIDRRVGYEFASCGRMALVRSASPAARGLRISVACLLLGLAALDQVRYVRAGRSDRRGELARSRSSKSVRYFSTNATRPQSGRRR